MEKPRRERFRSAAFAGLAGRSVGSARSRGIREVFPNQADVISHAHMHVAQNLVAQVIGQTGQFFLGSNKRSGAGIVGCLLGGEREHTGWSGDVGTDLRQRGKENLGRVIFHHLAILLLVQKQSASNFIEDC